MKTSEFITLYELCTNKLLIEIVVHLIFVPVTVNLRKLDKLTDFYKKRIKQILSRLTMISFFKSHTYMVSLC